MLSQFMEKPGHIHLMAAHRVLKYLKNAPGQGILMKAKSNFHISAYSNNNWARCPRSRKSITGFSVFIRDTFVSWKSKKQAVVARSYAKSKHRSMASTCCELIWLKHLLIDFGINHDDPIVLYSDSQSAIHISKNPMFHERAKYIEMDCHFIKEKVLASIITPAYIPTDLQVVDIFTKVLLPKKFY